MSVKPLNSQVYFSGGPVDGRTVVATEANITSISNAYVGMGVTVLNNGSPKKYTIKKLTILGKPDTKANGGYEEDIDTIGAASKESVNIIADKLDKLPSGMYYGQYSSVENLPAISSLEQKGYAYVASAEPNVYYIYLYNGDGEEWQDSGNKFVTTELETNLSTKSQTKAPTTKAVQEGIEAVDITVEQEYTSTQKGTARENIGAQEDIPAMQDKFPIVAALNDRVALSAEVEGVSKLRSMGYKVLKAPVAGDSTTSFQEQLAPTVDGTAIPITNTVFEVKDYFDLGDGTFTMPANSKLKIVGGKIDNGTLALNNCQIEATDGWIGENLTVSGRTSSIVYPDWYSDTEDNIKIEKALKRFGTVNLYPRTYTIEAPIKIYDSFSLLGQGRADGYYINHNTQRQYRAAGTQLIAGPNLTVNDAILELKTENVRPSGSTQHGISVHINGVNFMPYTLNTTVRCKGLFCDLIGYPERPFIIENCSFMFFDTALDFDSGSSTRSTGVILNVNQSVIAYNRIGIHAKGKKYFTGANISYNILSENSEKAVYIETEAIYKYLNMECNLLEAQEYAVDISAATMTQIRFVNNSFESPLTTNNKGIQVLTFRGKETALPILFEGNCFSVAGLHTQAIILRLFHVHLYGDGNKTFDKLYVLGNCSIDSKDVILFNPLQHMGIINQMKTPFAIPTTLCYALNPENCTPQTIPSEYRTIEVAPNYIEFERLYRRISDSYYTASVAGTANVWTFFTFESVCRTNARPRISWADTDDITTNLRKGRNIVILAKKPTERRSILRFHNVNTISNIRYAPASTYNSNYCLSPAYSADYTNLPVNINLLGLGYFAGDSHYVYSLQRISSVVMNSIQKQKSKYADNPLTTSQYVYVTESSNNNIILCFVKNEYCTNSVYKGAWGNAPVELANYTTFSTNASYSVGDVVQYNNLFYQFNSAKDAGEWDETKVDAVSEFSSTTSYPFYKACLHVDTVEGVQTTNLYKFIKFATDPIIQGNVLNQYILGYPNNEYPKIYCYNGYSSAQNVNIYTLSKMLYKGDHASMPLLVSSRAGQTYFDTDLKVEWIWDGSKWRQNSGLSGTTANRPTLLSTNVGFTYYDTTLGKPIYWSGNAWIDGNGETIGLQVSDTSILIGAAADSSTTINVYHANALNVSALNPDNTPATWLTVPSTIAVGTDTLTVSATPNATAPQWATDTYYSKNGNAYTLLTSAPNNWETNFFDYYTKTEVYSPVEGAEAPEWADDTYYSKSGDVYTLLESEPDTWSTTYGEYYTLSVTYSEVEGVAVTTPRGAKVIIEDGTDVVIVNVVQNYV